MKNLKMINKYILILLLFTAFSCNSQKKGSSIDTNFEIVRKDEESTIKKEESTIKKSDSFFNEKRDNVDVISNSKKGHDSLIESIIDRKEKEGSLYIKDSVLRKYVSLILLDSISSFKKLRALDCNDTIAYFKGLDFKGINYFIVLNRKKFEVEKHKIDLGKEYQQTYLIDDKPLWGAYRLPKREFDYFEVYINDTEVDFDKEYFNDIYNPSFCSFKREDGTNYEYLNSYVTKDSKYLFIYMKGGDGGGAYNIVWIFENGEYHSRVVELR